MFGALRTKLRLSQAAVVIQNLLELHGKGTDVQPIAAQVANRLVQKVYDERPRLFDGKEGAAPHKLSTAAAGLAWGVKYMGEQPDVHGTFFLSLGTILLEVTGKPNEYRLSSNDHVLLAMAQDIYMARAG